MGSAKKVASGAVIGGGGFGLEKIGNLIISATGAASGPFVNYENLIEISSTVLLIIGGLIALYGALEGIYGLWKSGTGG